MSHAKSVFEEEPKLLSIAMEDRSHTYLPRVAHSHADRAEILYVRGGNGMHVVDGKAYKTGPGNILIYNAGVLHDEQADSSVGMDIISCAFSVKIEGLPPNCVTPREWCPVLQNDDYASELEAVMTALYSAFKNGDKLPAEVRQPLLNSFLLSVVCAFLTGTIGLLAGYAIVRKKGSWLSAAVNHLTFFPYLIPSMAFGAIYLSMFSTRHGPIPALYGTFAILALIGTVKYLPFASRAGVNSMLQLGNEIEEAGIIMGISWWKRMIRIIIPIQKTSILSGYLLPYISCMRELSLFILLISPSTAVLTTMLFQYNEKGWNQYANAINLLIVLVVLLSNWVINKLTGASIDKGIG